MSEMTPMSTLTERIGALAQLKELKNEIAENLKISIHAPRTGSDSAK